MIVFHARPCREYPILCGEIQKKITNYYQFHEPFEMVDINQYKKNAGVLNYSPQQTIPNVAYYSAPDTICTKNLDIKTDLNGLSPNQKFTIPYKINLLYGIFPSNRLILSKNNFIFTIIDNPVDMIYNGFYYCKYITNINVQSLVKKVTGNYFQRGIEFFIDKILDKTFLNQPFLVNEIYYKMIKECFFIGDLSKYNFILFREDIKTGMENLRFILRSNFYCDKINSSITGETLYRRDDLEVFLQGDIEQYNQYKKKFLGK